MEKASIEFQMAAGQARSIVERWRKELLKKGWKEQTVVLQDMAGTVLLIWKSQSVTIAYTDVGFMFAGLTIDAFGIELEGEKD